MKKILNLMFLCLALSYQSARAQNCQACFTWLPDSVGNTINLDATCSTPAYPNANYEWIVDGQSYGGWPFPYFQVGFWNLGPHSVTLKITDLNGTCVDSTTQTVLLPIICNASFTSTNFGGGVYFNSNSPSSSATYSWDFGDGNTQIGAYPFHVYASPGTYNVCCTLTDSFSSGSCSDTFCNLVSVNNCFAIINTDSVLNNTYYLSSTGSSYDTSNTILNWSLNGILSQTGGTTFIATASTQFGDYVALDITDTTGAFCSSTNIFIFPNSGGSGNGCQACFTTNYLNNFGDSISFDASCSSIDSNNSFQWTVDGVLQTSTSSILVKQFTPGNHGISLYIIDNTGTICDSIYNSIFTWGPPCSSCLSISPVAGTTNQYTFDANCGASGMAYYSWVIDNNYISATMSPIFNYSFSQSGTYNICVIKTDSFGNQCSQACSTIVVNTPLQTQFNICGSIYKNNVNNIFWNYLPTGLNEAKVYLITLQSGGQLDAIDSTTTDANGGYCFYNKPIFDYRVKAALQSSSPDFSSNLPTYYQNATMWYNANVITLAQSNQYGKDLLLTYGANAGGSGFISGNVILGANKPARGTDYLDGLSIILVDAVSNNAIAYTKSDVGGNYTFGNLAPGQYKIYGELLNRQSSPAIVNLNNGNMSVSDINLEVNSNIIKPTTNGPLNVENNNKLNFQIFPNPTRNAFRVETDKSESKMIITDIVGNIVQKTNFDYSSIIDCSLWTKGFYFVKVKSGNLEFSQKLIVE